MLRIVSLASLYQCISDFVHDVLLRFYNVDTVNHLNDFIAVKNSDDCLMAQSKIIEVLRFLGFYVAFDKVTAPSDCGTFFGIEIDSA